MTQTSLESVLVGNHVLGHTDKRYLGTHLRVDVEDGGGNCSVHTGAGGHVLRRGCESRQRPDY